MEKDIPIIEKRKLFFRFLKEHKIYNRYVKNTKRLCKGNIGYILDRHLINYYDNPFAFNIYTSYEGHNFWNYYNDIWKKFIAYGNEPYSILNYSYKKDKYRKTKLKLHKYKCNTVKFISNNYPIAIMYILIIITTFLSYILLKKISFS